MPESLYKNAVSQLKEVAKLLKLSKKEVDYLSKPERFHKNTLRVKMDNGAIRQFKAFRSQHNSARGPYKGGIRFHPQVSQDEVMALSMWMSWKTAVVGIPYGGGKGGVVVDPGELSVGELERLSRTYAGWAGKFIGPWTDVPAPDVNTDSQVMAWMVDEIEKTQTSKTQKLQVNPRATFTGKPLEIGGSQGREEATGLGGFYTLEKLTHHSSLVTRNSTIAVQGIGNVGYWFAKFVSDGGYKVVAISDSKGRVYNPKGIDLEKVMEHKKKTGSVLGLYHELTNQELITLNVDVLVPAALENVITGENAKDVKAKVIIELANGPVAPKADEILLRRKILSVPDVLANAGGVTVSYFEWVQNLSGYYWEKQEVFEKLKIIMDRAFAEMWHVHLDKPRLSLRMCAYINAVSKVVSVMRVLGRI